MSKLHLYVFTALHLKPSQIIYRVWRRLGGTTRLRLGYSPSPDPSRADVSRVPVLPELDFDPAFLSRFDAGAILADRIELLHHEETVDWLASWHAPLSTPLWRFNLHYCEYLLPLAKAYLDAGDVRYLDKGKAIVRSWIDSCPRARGGVAWEPYVISMRIVNWLAFYGELRGELDADPGFVEALNRSLAEQFVHLSRHLEKDLLANHYLENLKALVILSCYFDDRGALGIALPKLYEQVDEQILPDGMHFELSPMYHKIVLEDLLRVAACLVDRELGLDEVVEQFCLRGMCDCLWSLERNVNRTPLFNDSGDNVSKSRDALLRCAWKRFGIEAVYHNCLPNAGYALLEVSTNFGIVKLIFDAGLPGPSYAMGHAHCDALSFECYIDGRPWIVNSGTYAYQDENRLHFKRTLSHNALKVDGKEQHECWAPFRVARYSEAALVRWDSSHVEGVLKQRNSGVVVRRSIILGTDSLEICDEVEQGHCITKSFIFNDALPISQGEADQIRYAPDFGVSFTANRTMIHEQDGLSRSTFFYPHN